MTRDITVEMTALITICIFPHLPPILASAYAFVLLFPPLSFILVLQAAAMAEYSIR